MDWFLYDKDLRHERVKYVSGHITYIRNPYNDTIENKVNLFQDNGKAGYLAVVTTVFL